MRNLTKLILASIGQVLFDWVGFQFLDEAKSVVESPTMLAPVQGYIGLIAIVGATAFACYVIFLIYSSRRTIATELKSVYPRAFEDTMDRLQQQAERDAVDKLSKVIIVMPSFGMSPYSHLTLHLSRNKDTPLKAHRPYYITNLSENVAFWTPEFLLKLANAKWIEWVTHNGEEALREYMKTQGIKLNERYPTNYKKDLGISLTELSKKLIPQTTATPLVETAPHLTKEMQAELAPSKPCVYAVSLAQEPVETRMREIRVLLETTDIRSEQARFYVVSLGVPLGAEDATDIQPCFNYPTTKDIYPLAIVPTTGKPWILVTWPPPPTAPDFDRQEDGFAKALTLDKSIRVEKLNLGAGHALQPFIFFFTVRGRNSIYFPSEIQIAFDMPTKFQTALLLQAKGRPLVVVKTFEIEAKSWDSVTVNEIRGSPSNLAVEKVQEFDVKWLLCGVALPFEPYGHGDMPGSEHSKLHVIQRGERISLAGTMVCLKPSHVYEVEFGPPYLVGRPIPDDDIYSAFRRLGSLTTFTTDAHGECHWNHEVTVGELRTYGAKPSRFSLWIGDTADANRTVLMSETFGIST